MKFIIPSTIAALALCGFGACTTPATVPVTQTTNDKLAIGIEGITAARRESTAAMTAGKITLLEDQATQEKLDIARASLVAAQLAVTAVAASAPASGAK